MARGERLWMKGADGLRVYVAAKVQVDGDDAHAEYDLDTNKIRVAATDRNVMGAKLFHELVHKATHGLPGGARQDIFGEIDEDEYTRREEALCEMLEQRLYPLLVSNKWLRFPAPPKSKG